MATIVGDWLESSGESDDCNIVSGEVSGMKWDKIITVAAHSPDRRGATPLFVPRPLIVRWP